MKTLIAMALGVLLAAPTALSAKPWWLRGTDSNETDYLPPDAAFRVGARVDGNLIRVRWAIADGYYLYRQRMQIAAESPDLRVSIAAFPQGTVKTDQYLGTQEIYTQEVEGTVAFTQSDYGAHPMQIKVTYQGCAEAGLCYPPITKVLFPAAAAAPQQSRGHPWEGFAIGGGVVAFFLSGLLLRKGRRLDSPAT